MEIIENDIKKHRNVGDEEVSGYDDFDFFDWAENNMNWEDVKNFAECVLPPRCEYQDGWCNGDKEIQEIEKGE